jgi:hypothetical protein
MIEHESGFSHVDITGPTLHQVFMMHAAVTRDGVVQLMVPVRCMTKRKVVVEVT